MPSSATCSTAPVSWWPSIGTSPGSLPLGAGLVPLVGALGVTISISQARQLDQACFRELPGRIAPGRLQPDPRQVRLCYLPDVDPALCHGATIGQMLPRPSEPGRTARALLEGTGQTEETAGENDPGVVNYYMAIAVAGLKALGLGTLLRVAARTARIRHPPERETPRPGCREQRSIPHEPVVPAETPHLPPAVDRDEPVLCRRPPAGAAQGWLVATLTNSALAVGGIGVLSSVGMLLMPLGGVIADQVDRRRILIVGQWAGCLADRGHGFTGLHRAPWLSGRSTCGR